MQARCVSICKFLYVWLDVDSLRLKPAVTTAHGHTVGADAVKIDGDDTITKVVGHHSRRRRCSMRHRGVLPTEAALQAQRCRCRSCVF